MIASILLTGAFHEDGFADVCDGFGGGWTKDKILAIMKDSAIGAYGTIGITLMLLLKFFLLYELAKSSYDFFVIYTILIGHSTSRLNAVWTIYLGRYARENEDAKAKPVAKSLSITSLIFASAIGLLPLLLLMDFWIFYLIMPLAIIRLYLSSYFKKWIDGYTGDCLGAIQQCSEIIVYIYILSMWKYI